MVKVSWHASHEQFPPSELLDLAMRAEAAGFAGALSSDHFHPWSERQGQSGFAWSWLGAAMARTRLTFGVVNAPGQRYHPAIIAQAAATLSEMFPDRLWVAFGSGQAVNEAITGERWPLKPERNARLLEAVGIIRSLWAGDTVTHRGRIIVEDAKLYSRPARPPLIAGAALTPETARWVGSWADALITTSRPPAALKKMIESFHAGGGKGKPLFLKVQLSYATDERTAREGAWDQWRSSLLPSEAMEDLRSVRQFDAVAERLRPEVLDENVHVSADLGRHAAWLADYASLGFEELILHNVNREQARFIETFGEKVLPRLR
jgi:coenzyme F420-dependent glucose-6-phosphate dehydrogenase